MLRGSQITISPGAALIADQQRHSRVGTGIFVDCVSALPLDRVLDDLAEQGSDVVGIDPSLASLSLDPGKDFVLTEFIAIRFRWRFLFGLQYERNQFVSGCQLVDNALADFVKGVPDLLE